MRVRFECRVVRLGEVHITHCWMLRLQDIDDGQARLGAEVIGPKDSPALVTGEVADR